MNKYFLLLTLTLLALTFWASDVQMIVGQENAASGPPIEIPETEEERKELLDKFMEAFPKGLKNAFQTALGFWKKLFSQLKEIWHKSFFEEKVGEIISFFKEQIEIRKLIFKQEFKKEWEEFKKELPKLFELFEKLFELFEKFKRKTSI